MYSMITAVFPFEHVADIIKGDYKDPVNVSPQCVDLIRSMLQVDVKKRATIQQIKSHPWMTMENLQENGDGSVSSLESTTSSEREIKVTKLNTTFARQKTKKILQINCSGRFSFEFTKILSEIVNNLLRCRKSSALSCPLPRFPPVAKTKQTNHLWRKQPLCCLYLALAAQNRAGKTEYTCSKIGH